MFLVVVTAPFLVREIAPAWVWMWILAGLLFFAAKWLTIYPLLCSEQAFGAKLLIYAFLWVGLDAPAFLGRATKARLGAIEWFAALKNIVAGAFLAWVVIRWMGDERGLVKAWLGMAGIVLLLHFGVFQLLSLAWRSYGVNAKSLMCGPLGARSVSEFWGARWNTGFSDLAHRHVFKPLVPRLGAKGALFVTFLFSGVLHECVISVPARGGYGLAMLYFVLQGLALLFERSGVGKRMGLGNGWKGWCFTMLSVLVPCPMLFHPWFVQRVILPMLKVFGGE